MFEKISFATQDIYNVNEPIDIGHLVECLLFYGKTTVIANHSILRQLLKAFGVDNLITLIDEEILDIIYTESNVGVLARTINGVEHHDFGEISSEKFSKQEYIRTLCIDLTGKEGKGRRQARRIENKITASKHDHMILEGTRETILDSNYLNQAARLVLQNLVPEIGSTQDLIFEAERPDKEFIIKTNLDFGAINKLYHQRIPPSHSTITRATVLSHILNSEKEFYFSSALDAELATNPVTNQLGSLKINELLNKTTKSGQVLSNFLDFSLDSTKSIREAINSSQLLIDDIIPVILNSTEFKKWILGKEFDGNLIKEYHQEVIRETPFEKLPGKTTRWGVFTGLGFGADLIATGGIGTAIGVSLGVLDTFFLDKLLTGWKPNQYISDINNLLYEKNT